MNVEDVVGLMVMVHHLLVDDPAERTGQIGIIMGADRSQDDYFVRFDDEATAHYSADALQVLQPPEKLYELLENRQVPLSPGMRKDLLSIALLQRYGSAKQIKTAFELVQQHEHLQPYATLGLDEVLGGHRSYRIGR